MGRAWNHRLPLFESARVRRALTLTADRRGLLGVLGYPEDAPIVDVPVDQRHLLSGRLPEALPYDPERAAALLESEGWIDTDGDGIRERGGVEFSFTATAEQETSAHAVYLQDRFRRVGIDMQVEILERSVMRERLRDADFEAVFWDYNFVEQFRDFPLTGYRNPEANRLRDLAWYSIDPQAVDRHLEELWAIVEEDLPVTYLHPIYETVVAHRRVGGLDATAGPDYAVEHLSLDGS